MPINFPKSYISGITKVSGFEWYASLVLSPPTPSNKLYDAGDSLQLVCDLLQNRPEVSVWRIDLWALPRSDISHLEVEPEVAPVEARCRQAATFRPVTAPFPPQQRPFRPVTALFRPEMEPFLPDFFTWL